VPELELEPVPEEAPEDPELLPMPISEVLHAASASAHTTGIVHLIIKILLKKYGNHSCPIRVHASV
jgi:hypothetical protein